MMIIAALLLAASTLAAAEADHRKPGTTIFESAAFKDCKTFNKPKRKPEDPAVEDRSPYRGEDMLKPIGPLDGSGAPPIPTARNMTFPETIKRNGKAKAVVTINAGGQVVRVEATSSTDARLAAFFAANVSLWQYAPQSPADNCRKIDVELEIEAD